MVKCFGWNPGGEEKITHKLVSTCMTILTILTVLIIAVFSTPYLFGFRVFAVVSGSMEPVYHVGALIFTEQVTPEEIHTGDCITYTYGSNTVTHRVIRVDRKHGDFITQGDANSTVDDPVSFSRLVGKTMDFSIPLLGYLVIWLKRTNDKLIFFLAMVVILLIIVNGVLFHKKENHKE